MGRFVGFNRRATGVVSSVYPSNLLDVAHNFFFGIECIKKLEKKVFNLFDWNILYI